MIQIKEEMEKELAQVEASHMKEVRPSETENRPQIRHRPDAFFARPGGELSVSGCLKVLNSWPKEGPFFTLDIRVLKQRRRIRCTRSV